MTGLIHAYLLHRGDEGAPLNTTRAYSSDLNRLLAFIDADDTPEAWRGLTTARFKAWVASIGHESNATIARRIAAARVFYRWLVREGIAAANPAEPVYFPRVASQPVVSLTADEVTMLFRQAALKPGYPGLRDEAMIAVLLATGANAQEVVDLKVTDVQDGHVWIAGPRHRGRRLRLDPEARLSLDAYLTMARPVMARGASGGVLFVNWMGHPMTRQGLWAILAEYGTNPTALRTTFLVRQFREGASIADVKARGGLRLTNTVLPYKTAAERAA